MLIVQEKKVESMLSMMHSSKSTFFPYFLLFCITNRIVYVSNILQVKLRPFLRYFVAKKLCILSMKQ